MLASGSSSMHGSNFENLSPASRIKANIQIFNMPRNQDSNHRYKEAQRDSVGSGFYHFEHIDAHEQPEAARKDFQSFELDSNRNTSYINSISHLQVSKK